MLIRKKITALIFSFASVIFLLPTLVLAQDSFGSNALDDLSTVPATSKDIFEIITSIVNILLYFLGSIAVLLFMYAGWLWFTSQGNKDKIEKAKKIMISAVIGLFIIFGSYAAVNWIFREAIQRAFYGGGGTADPRYGGGVGLGGGVIESHYPEPNAKSIPRNTNIYVTFKEPMKLDTIASNTGCTGTNPKTCPIITNNIRLHNTTEAETINVTNMTVTFDPGDLTVFEFNPYGLSTTDPYLLGEQTRDIKYKMSLVNLMTATNRQAFNFGSYSWFFTVGTYSDNTPPRVISVRPKAGATSPRNTIVQINFSEAINPTLATGLVPGYDNIKIAYQDTAGVEKRDPGKYVISNQYRTVEFIPNDLCGQNSCGLNIFCLTGPEDFTGTVTTNIKDMVGNALVSEKTWDFSTAADIDRNPPKMVDMSPISNFKVNQPVQMTFDKSLLSSSIKSSNIKLFQGTNIPINYWLSLSDGTSLENNVINIRHERLAASTSYLATTTSGIMDENQNCWYPCRCEGPNCNCTTPGATCVTGAGAYCQTQ